MSTRPDATTLNFEDCSLRPRCGCKGPGAESWLQANGFTLPAAANGAALDADGVLVARLATSEFLLESTAHSGAGATRVSGLRTQLSARSQPRDVYAVARQDAVQTITGTGLMGLLRQICSVDFEPLLAAEAAPPPTGAADRVVLTSMIGVGVVAWPQPAATPSLTLWCDPSFGHYFWTTLREVAGSDR